MTTTTKARTLFSVALDRDPLLALVGRVRSVVERKSTIPILSNLRLTASGGKLQVAGTDLDMEIVESVPCDGHGDITVEADKLSGLLAKIPSGAQCSLTFSEDDPRLVLKAGRSRYLLPVLPASDFPMMATDGLGPAMHIDTSDFERLLEKVSFAMSTEETRYYLNGAFLHPLEVDGVKKLRAVATDGARLALADMAAPDPSPEVGLILPRKTVREIGRLLPIAGEKIILRMGRAKVQLEAGGAVLTSKVIDGAFPPYERVVPVSNPNILRLDRAILAACVERAMVMSTERVSTIRMEVEPGKVVLNIRGNDSGQGAEEIEADYASDSVAIGFNGRYLLDVLTHIEGEHVELQLAGPLDPVLALDPLNAAVRFVIMPLRA